MIDPGKLLGGLLGGRGALGALSGLGQSAKGSLGGAAAGMGLLGVAMAAFEHFSQQKAGAAPMPGAGTPPPSFPGQASTPPPTAPQFGTQPPSSGFGVAPPPPPASFGATPSPRSAGPAVAPSSWQTPVPDPHQADPFLLIRAMIAATNADGVLDENERSRILGQLEQAGLTPEEKSFIYQEFDAPWSIARLAAAVPSPAVAAQVLAVSLLAIDVDTREEEDHLENLRLALGLDVEQARAIAKSLGKTK